MRSIRRSNLIHIAAILRLRIRFAIRNDENRCLFRRTEDRRAGSQAIFIYSYLGKIATEFIIDNSFASMPLGICASRHKILKHGGQSDVQNDVNSLTSYLLRTSKFTLSLYPSPERGKFFGCSFPSLIREGEGVGSCRKNKRPEGRRADYVHL